MWGPFGQAADEALFSLQQSFDPVAKKWEVKGLAPLGARSGAFVAPLTMEPPYDQMTIVAWGGTLGPPPGSWFPANPLTTLTTVDKNGNVSSRMAGNLNHARWFSSGVLLPDGNLIAVGGADKDEVIDPGTEIPVLQSEEFNPSTGQWTEVAAHTRDRVYHNSALLLPDMRVLLGGNAPNAFESGIEVDHAQGIEMHVDHAVGREERRFHFQKSTLVEEAASPVVILLNWTPPK